MAIAIAIGVGGCDSWFGDTGKPPIPGERIPVLSLEQTVNVDPRISDLRVTIPRPESNSSWPQPGGTPNHAMHHLAASGNLAVLWRADIGRGADSESHLLAQPVVANGRVFTLDVVASVRAFDAATGRNLWRRDLRPKDDGEGILGGGLAFNRGRLYVTTGFGQVIAVDAEDGSELWRRGVSGPMRAGPTVLGGRVFVVTIANSLHVLHVEDGRNLWSHTGIAETAGLLGGASPAVEGDVVIAPFSSGEIFALRTDNGRVVWSETLSSLRRTDPVSSLAHVRGVPVIDRGAVFVISHSGRMMAVDLRSGSRIWEQPIGGTQPPWVAGEFIYVLSITAELICLSRRDGRVRWVKKIQRYENEKERKGPLSWTGPVLAGDRLLVAGSNREIWSFSPYTGESLGRIRLSGPIYIQPAIANETVYVLTADADLIALR